MIRRPRLVLILAFVVACLAIAACGGDDDNAATRSPSSSTIGSITPTPAPPTASPVGLLYVVQDGDSLGGIATMFGVSLADLMEANGIGNPDSIHVGEVLTIPGVVITAIPTEGPVTETPIITTPNPPSGEVTTFTLVDKTHALPADYTPSNLTPVPADYVAPAYSATMTSSALAAMQRMLDGARDDGFDIRVVSGYRSFADQEYTYNYWVQQLGEEEANRISARPGHSEHQLGTTADLGSATFGYDLREEFGAIPEGQWLAANSAEYGFVISYPDGKEDITGYSYEPWHLRFIGPDAATAQQASGLTLNQYLAGLQ